MNSTRIDKQVLGSHGISVDTMHWGRIFRGSAGALIAVGLVRAEWLPSEVRRSTRIAMGATGPVVLLPKRPAPKGVQCVCVKRLSLDRYDVWIDYTEQEKREAEFESAVRRQAEAIARLPTTRDEFKEQAIDIAARTLVTVRELLGRRPDKMGGYSAGGDFIDRFDDAARELLRVIKDAPAVLDSAARDRALGTIRRETVGDVDPEFVAFLEATTVLASACRAAQ